MSPLIESLNTFSTLWSTIMWRVCWQGGLALLLVWIICRLFPRLPAKISCWLWRAAAIRLLVAVVVTGTMALPWLPPSPALPVRLVVESPFATSAAPRTDTPVSPKVPAPPIATPPREHPSVITGLLFLIWLARACDDCGWRGGKRSDWLRSHTPLRLMTYRWISRSYVASCAYPGCRH